MAQELLVEQYLTDQMMVVGAKVVEALDKAGLPIHGAFWMFDPEHDAWRFVIAMPEVSKSGPRDAYRRVRSAIAKGMREGPRIETSDLSVIDTTAPLYVLLRSMLKTGNQVSGIRFTNNTINGRLIEDCYIYRVT